MKTAAAILLSSIALLSGCSAFAPAIPLDVDAQGTPRIIKLTAVGYGAGGSFEKYSTGQRKLMAMRASKLDAYRALAEQVQGVRITGGSTVSAMMMQNESFRVYIDAYLRGARIVSVAPIADGNIETTIELDFDTQLVRSFATQVPLRSQSGAYYEPGSSARGSVGSGTVYGSSFYFSE